MTKIIKEVTLKEIARIQNNDLDNVSLAHLTMRLQSMIIINVSVGTAYADTVLEYENKDGTVECLSLPDYLDRIIVEQCMRFADAHNILFPLFMWVYWFPSDWRLGRNNKRFRNKI